MSITLYQASNKYRHTHSTNNDKTWFLDELNLPTMHYHNPDSYLAARWHSTPYFRRDAKYTKNVCWHGEGREVKPVDATSEKH